VEYAPGGSSLYMQGLLPDDDTRAGGTNSDNDFAWTPTNGSIGYVWNVSYRAVLRSNLILQQLELTDQLTPAQKGRFEGEAKFVRAYFNFILARFFGTPPVITKVATSIEETRQGNSAQGEVWDLIESDLEAAIKGLAGLKLENGRASETAARALLGKVELYRAQWGTGNAAILKGVTPAAKYAEAVAHLQEVVNSGTCAGGVRCALVPYENNFKYTTENNAESLFEMQASFGTDINGWAATDENGGGASSGTGRPIVTGASSLNGVVAPGGNDWAYGSIIITQKLVDEFEPGDPRAYFTFYSTGENYGRACGTNPAPYNYRFHCSGGQTVRDAQANWSVTGYTSAKYIRPFENFGGGMMLNQSVSQNNERLIRYGDVLLLLAEAKLLASNDVAGAAALINQVRARARAAYDRAYGPQSADAALYADRVKPADLLPDRPSNVSRDQMLQWLMHERRVELAMEIFRYDDLVRWLRAGLIQRSSIDFGDPIANQRFNPAVHLLRPLPLGDLDLNKNLTQNPGY
jgi:starch-binding outer membrane protein, SusD/RagB family